MLQEYISYGFLKRNCCHFADDLSRLQVWWDQPDLRAGDQAGSLCGYRPPPYGWRTTRRAMSEETARHTFPASDRQVMRQVKQVELQRCRQSTHSCCGRRGRTVQHR
ncbi:unnamed protein product [Symbiodinium sp. CCMP2592]|nr:unnamed protein product [Symbiodinium sp. CCMP2592]